jgi:glycosyltransferase involved in cell wall biosynthesis
MSGASRCRSVRSQYSVAYVFPGGVDGIGGAETQALHFFQHHNRQRIKATLILLGANPTFADRAGAIQDFEVQLLNRACRPMFHPAVAWEVVRFFRRRQFDIVHLYGLGHEIFTRPLARISGHSCVVSAIRGLETHRGLLHSFLNWATSRWVDLWIANSEDSQRLFSQRDRLPLHRIAVIPNGVPVGEAPTRRPPVGRQLLAELGISPDVFVIGCVANHLPAKRIGDIITALARVVAGGVDAVLVSVGRTTEHTEDLKGMAERRAVAERVFFTGYREDVPQLVSEFDVFVLASEKEGMPASVLEAMAAGIPVACTPVAALKTLVLDGETGFHFPVGDPEALTGSLSRLSADPELVIRMGDAGFQRVRQHYSVERMVENVTSAYEQLLREGRPER